MESRTRFLYWQVEIAFHRRGSSSKSPGVVQSLWVDRRGLPPLGAGGKGPDFFSRRGLSHEQVKICRVYSRRLPVLESDPGLSGLAAGIIVGHNCRNFQVHQHRRLRSPHPTNSGHGHETDLEKKPQEQSLANPTTRSMHKPLVQRGNWMIARHLPNYG